MHMGNCALWAHLSRLSAHSAHMECDKWIYIFIRQFHNKINKYAGKLLSSSAWSSSSSPILAARFSSLSFRRVCICCFWRGTIFIRSLLKVKLDFRTVCILVKWSSVVNSHSLPCQKQKDKFNAANSIYVQWQRHATVAMSFRNGNYFTRHSAFRVHCVACRMHTGMARAMARRKNKIWFQACCIVWICNFAFGVRKFKIEWNWILPL